jgi:hypothetical protein
LDKLSLLTPFQDSLSDVSHLILATTLENFQIVPHCASGAVFAEGRQRAYLGAREVEAGPRTGDYSPTGGRSADAETVGSVIERRLSS